MMKLWKTANENCPLIETAWERQMQILGADQYEIIREKADPSSTVAGKKLLREMFAVAADGIEQNQTELSNRQRISSERKTTVLDLPAETLALIGLKQVLDKAYRAGNSDEGFGWRALSQTIGQACETEMNYRLWLKQSREKAKSYAKDKGLPSTPISFADRMLADKSSPKANKFRIRKAIKEVSTRNWTLEERIFCGDFTLTTLCDYLPDYLSRKTVRKKQKTHIQIALEPFCRQQFDDIEYAVSNTQYALKPMLVKPRRWTLKAA